MTRVISLLITGMDPRPNYRDGTCSHPGSLIKQPERNPITLTKTARDDCMSTTSKSYMPSYNQRLPCRGCTRSCVYYPNCNGKPWRMQIAGCKQQHQKANQFSPNGYGILPATLPHVAHNSLTISCTIRHNGCTTFKEALHGRGGQKNTGTTR